MIFLNRPFWNSGGSRSGRYEFGRRMASKTNLFVSWDGRLLVSARSRYLNGEEMLRVISRCGSG